MNRAPLAYRALLRLFPRSFREEFGPDMAQLLRDQMRETQGPGARARLWASALLDLGNQAVREWGRVVRLGTRDFIGEGLGMDVWMQDLTYSIRSLLRRPGFTLAAIVTLALGMGANLSIFSVVNGVLLQPLPYPEPDDLVVVWSADQVNGVRGSSVDHPDIRALQEAIPDLLLSGISGTRPTLTGFGDPEVILGTRVTDGLVTLMGLTPHLGRDLVAADDVADGPRVVVVSHEFWSERLGQDPNVLGTSLTLGDEPWEIVGVAPAGFDYPNGAQMWFPRRHQVDGCGHGCRIMNAVGRVPPGSTIDEMEGRMQVVAAGFAEQFPDSHRDETFELQSMLDSEVEDVRSALWALLGAVGMVLLIACANVANLMIVRAQGRAGEVALRATLGATRLRIARQLLTESALIAGLAGVLALGLAYWGSDFLIAQAPETLPRLDEAGIDPTVVAFAGFLVLFVTGVFGALPAFQLSRQPLHATLSGGRRSIGRHGRETSRSALLVAEVALSLTLLLGAGLLVRTLGAVRAVELGFETESIERFRLSLPSSKYDSLGIVAFQEEMERTLTEIPGVRSAGWGFGVPLASGSISTTITFLDRPELEPADRPSIDIRPVSVGYLDAAGMTLQRGRWFGPQDRYGDVGTAVINESLARIHYPDSDPIGQSLRADISWSFAEFPAATIVGIVKDVIKAGPMTAPQPAIYIPNAQFGASTGYVSLRLEPGVETAIPEARRRIAEMDPGLAIWNTTTMEEVVRDAHASTTFYLTLLSVFSALAVLLAGVGLYGVVAFTVGRRTREIGIRIALGAASDEVVTMILKEGIRPAALGVVVGLVTSWFASKALASMLFGVSPQDPITLVTVTGILMVVVVVATAIPARHASRIPPSSALQSE